MKKRILALMVVLLMGIQSLPITGALDRSIKVSIDGELIQLENQAFVDTDKNRILVPLRGVFESLGIHVDYNKETKQVIAKTKQVEVVMNLYDDLVLVDGKVIGLDVGTMVFDQRTYVPIRFIAESFGHGVYWNQDTRTVEITRNEWTPQSDVDLPTLGSAAEMLALLSYNNTLNDYIYGTRQLDFMPLEAEAVATDSNSADGSAEKSYSDTNNQVKGVQESDTIKTDGVYIYQVVSGAIHIYSADPNNLERINTIEPKDFHVTEIFLNKKQLIAYGRTSVYYGPYVDEVVLEKEPVESSQAMVDMLPYYNQEETYVAVYDLLDIQNEVLTHHYKFDGYFLSGRVIEDNLYFVTNKSFWLYDIWTMREEGTSLDTMNVLPSYTDLLTGLETELNYDDIAYFPDKVSSNYMLTIGLNLKTNQLDVDAYLGYGDQVYVSQNNLYTSVNHYDYNIKASDVQLYQPAYDVNTVIYQFNLANGQVEFSQKAWVPGTLLNQFSMDEYKGYLRVATTKQNLWWWANDESTNNVYVLDEDLKEVGSIEDLAKGERIYSTRFMGDRIYMVTFKQVDPFFVISLEDPTQPLLLGYLKIPGFSTYMHPIDENHLLGFGQDTKLDEFGRVVTGGFKISLFDVTDYENPIEADQLVIGNSGTYSELAYNHKALMYTTPGAIMALPLSVAGTKDYYIDFVGAFVFDVTTEAVELRGSVTHHDQLTTSEAYGYQYFDYNYGINRIVYIEGYLYTFSNNRVIVYDLLNLKETSRLEIK